MLVASYASVVGLHYLVGFILIIIIYWKILKRIKLIRNNRGEYNTYDPYSYTVTILIVIPFDLTVFLFVFSDAGRKQSTQAWYGAAPSSPAMGRGEKRARTRVVAFLTVFVVVGLISKPPSIRSLPPLEYVCIVNFCIS